MGKINGLSPVVSIHTKNATVICNRNSYFLPVNLYAGQLENIGAIDFIRMLIFDGTFYHLWYLPASVMGVLILWILGKKFNFNVLLIICMVLYGFGLLGDSYYGFTGMLPSSKAYMISCFYVFFLYKKRNFLCSCFSDNGGMVRSYHSK